MVPSTKMYEIWPVVVEANKPTEMFVLPASRAYIPREECEYTIKIISLFSDEPSAQVPVHHKEIIPEKRDGALCFTHTFEDEQEHVILLFRDGKQFSRMSVYSLHKDLYELTPYKGDLHAHSCRSDGSNDPAELLGQYREQGYDYLALTDHNRYYPGEEIDDAYNGVALGITRIKGEEVHPPRSPLHIIHIGGKKSLTKFYFENPEAYDAEIAEVAKKVPDSIPEQFRDRYARAMWATERIHEAGGAAIFPHPFWKPGATKTCHLPVELTRAFLRSGMFDAYELVGCMGWAEHSLSIAMWGEMREKEGLHIPVVASSDTHGTNGVDTFPCFFSISFAKDRDNDSIVEAIKDGRVVAVEAISPAYEKLHRVYGDFRFVTYAQWLVDNYFPRLKRTCQGEGIAMRNYLMGNADKELIEAQVKQSENFKLRFFGRVKPTLPSKEIMDFEDKWREVQLNSPKTRGSYIGW